MNWIKILPVLAIGLLAASAANAGDVPKGRHITVSGAGSVRARPDLAIAELGVTARGETATLAMSDSRRRVASLLLALRDNGVDEKDVLTTDFAIYRETVPAQRRAGDADEERFVVRNLLQITIRDLERAGLLVDRLVEAGANEVRAIRFALQDDRQMSKQARELAAQDAHDKAEHLASLHGARLGKALRISESGVRAVRPEAMMMKAMDTSSSTVSAGELTFAAQLEVVYELKD